MELSAKLLTVVFVVPAALATPAAAPAPAAGGVASTAAAVAGDSPMGLTARVETQQREESAVEARRIDLRVDIRPRLPTALIEADLTFDVTESTDSVAWFLSPTMNLDAIEDAAGLPLTYQRRRSVVRVTTPSLGRGTTTTWTFRYRARLDASLEEAGQLLLTTPWYPHQRVAPRPGEFVRYVPMPMTLTATLPDPWVLVSAGTNRTSRADSESTTYVWSDSVPSTDIPLVIGRFTEHSKLERVGALRGFFPPADRSLIDPYIRFMTHAAEFFSDRIGPLNRRSWNLVAVELPENISGVTVPGVTFLDRHEVDVRDAFPYRVLAHEIAHHWWNHYIVIPRSRDAWLREGLPTYSSLLFLENEYGNQMMRLELERSRRVALAVDSDEALQIGFEMSTPDAVYAFNYHKAAVVLHMLREVIGLDGFTELCRALHGLGSDITTDVFIEHAEQVYGDDLSWFFDAWLRTADVPSFRVRYQVHLTDSSSTRYELTGTIEQRDAAIRYPVLVRVPLEAAPPLETTVWIEPGTTEFNIVLPSPARDLQFDPFGDLLYREVSVEAMGPAARPAPLSPGPGSARPPAGPSALNA